MGVTGTLLYMALLGFGSVISPGVGISGDLIALLPLSVTDFSHMPAYALLTWLLTSGLRRRGWPLHFAVCAGGSSAFVFGLWMEIAQAFVPGRVVDTGDLWMNTAGIGMSTALMIWRLLPIDRPFLGRLPFAQTR